jgi:glycosyltransferase involved in cell wall biosynthesis
LTIPSGGPSLPPRRRVRMLALLQARNEMRYLPRYVANVAPQLDGIVALDDGSRDGSAEYLEDCDSVLEVLRRPPDRPAWDEQGNLRALVEAARQHEAEWLLALDADERLEREFRVRAERVIRRGGLLGFTAYGVRLRELWEAPDRFRADGIWGDKVVARLFQARADHEFDPRPLHGRKVPVQALREGSFAIAALEIYHLRMIHAADRAARRARYEALDPEARYQPGIGYAYLTDETGLRLEPIAPERGYVE